MTKIPEEPCEAAAFVDGAMARRPELLIETADLPATARALRDLISRSSAQLFDRDGPVLVIPSPHGCAPSIRKLSTTGVVIETHKFCQPVRLNQYGELVQVTLPERLARIYLELYGEHRLRPLAGVSTAPLLGADGSIRNVCGYDPATQMYCTGIPDMISMVPMVPMLDDAKAALLLLRETFKTFPFADAVRKHDPTLGVDVVDLSRPPGADESAFLVALLTAVCRPSLPLAPGLLVTAPAISGAGSGKGLLVRSICVIAFGVQPRAFTTGSERQELDKRLAAELIEAAPSLFLDNANGHILNSDTLASVMTERPARIRILGESRMVELNSTAFIAATGNGLAPSGDLARRFITCQLDPQCEDPEARPFRPGFPEEIQRRRPELLAAVLTIWRFGRQNEVLLRRGRSLGSFEIWTEWCRDVLLTLGCCDPVERITEAKSRDPQRQKIAAILEAWWKHHRSRPMKASQLHKEVTDIIAPHGEGRQFVASEVGMLPGTRTAGFVLSGHKGAAKSSPWKYQLCRVDAPTADAIGHPDHQDHQDHAAPLTEDGGCSSPMPPMPDETQLDLVSEEV